MYPALRGRFFTPGPPGGPDPGFPGVVARKRIVRCFFRVSPPQIWLQREGGPLPGVLEALELQVQSPDGLRFGGGLRAGRPASGVLP